MRCTAEREIARVSSLVRSSRRWMYPAAAYQLQKSNVIVQSAPRYAFYMDKLPRDQPLKSLVLDYRKRRIAKEVVNPTKHLLAIDLEAALPELGIAV